MNVWCATQCEGRQSQCLKFPYSWESTGKIDKIWLPNPSTALLGRRNPAFSGPFSQFALSGKIARPHWECCRSMQVRSGLIVPGKRANLHESFFETCLDFVQVQRQPQITVSGKAEHPRHNQFRPCHQGDKMKSARARAPLQPRSCCPVADAGPAHNGFGRSASRAKILAQCIGNLLCEGGFRKDKPGIRKLTAGFRKLASAFRDHGSCPSDVRKSSSAAGGCRGKDGHSMVGYA